MARKPKAPEQDSTPAVPDADILPESQQPEQTEAPPFEVGNQPPSEVSAEEAAVSEEDKAAPFDMGELFPDHGEVVISADLTEQLLSKKNGAKIAAAKEAEAAAAVIDFSQQEQPAEEDTRQEWEKPLAEIEAEQQPKRRGRPPKKDKDTSGQIGAVDKVLSSTQKCGKIKETAQGGT